MLAVHPFASVTNQQAFCCGADTLALQIEYRLVGVGIILAQLDDTCRIIDFNGRLDDVQLIDNLTIQAIRTENCIYVIVLPVVVRR